MGSELGNYREKATEAHRTVASLGEQTRNQDQQILSLKGNMYSENCLGFILLSLNLVLHMII